MRISALCFFLICVATGSAFSQFTPCCPYIGPITILPAIPTTADTIRIVTFTSTPDQGDQISYGFTVNADSIHLEGCFFDSWLTQPQPYQDTSIIGILGPGIYYVDYIGKISYTQGSCIVADSQIVRSSFEVFGANAIDDADFERKAVTISPNPTQDFLNVDASRMRGNLHCVLYNLWGQVCFSSDFTLRLDIDLSHMASGVYFLRFEGQGFHFAQKVLKN